MYTILHIPSTTLNKDLQAPSWGIPYLWGGDLHDNLFHSG